MVEIFRRLRLWNGESSETYPSLQHLSAMFRTIYCVSFSYRNSQTDLRWQDYWFQGPQDTSGDIRFLTTPRAFCIIAFSRPTNGQLVINKRLPILPGDKIVLLSPSIASHNADRSRSDSATGLPWSLDSSGRLVVNVSESDLSGIEYAWAFQVRYRTEE
jgi:hypothetical protein